MDIKREVVDEIIEACKNSYPHEFFAYLGSDSKKYIDNYQIVPYFYQANDSVSFRSDLKPLLSGSVGTAHSHPSPSNRPSRADLESFRQNGNIHLIVAYPYNYSSIGAYNREGESIAIKMID